jgi:hypothetical protein
MATPISLEIAHFVPCSGHVQPPFSAHKKNSASCWAGRLSNAHRSGKVPLRHPRGLLASISLELLSTPMFAKTPARRYAKHPLRPPPGPRGYRGAAAGSKGTLESRIRPQSPAYEHPARREGCCRSCHGPSAPRHKGQSGATRTRYASRSRWRKRRPTQSFGWLPRAVGAPAGLDRRSGVRPRKRSSGLGPSSPFTLPIINTFPSYRGSLFSNGRNGAGFTVLGCPFISANPHTFVQRGLPAPYIPIECTG